MGLRALGYALGSGSGSLGSAVGAFSVGFALCGGVGILLLEIEKVGLKGIEVLEMVGSALGVCHFDVLEAMRLF